MTAVSLGRYLRTQHSLKVRQPLKKAVIVVHNDDIRAMPSETSDIIAEELNVKAVELQADESSLVNRSVKANFKKLGPKLGKEMKDASEKIAALSDKDVSLILSGKTVRLTLASGTVLDLVEEDLVVQRQEKEGMTVATEKVITVALDTVVDRALEEEGFAREFVSRIQNMRKEQNFDVSDRIKISYSIGGGFSTSILNYKEYICNETLCVELSENIEGAKEPAVCDINGVESLIAIEKSSNK